VDSLADLVVPLSPTELLERVASELFLCFRLAVRLYSYLGLGLKWLTGFYRLVLYAMLLLPGFIQVSLQPTVAHPVSWSAAAHRDRLTAERS
jgi:prenylcysteine alpha-carboxyl methylesterase